MIRTSQRWLVALALLAPACGGSTDSDGAGPGGTCIHDGKVYSPGESYMLDCNTCTCQQGDFACTTMGCAQACMYEGVAYPVGSSFPSIDGCNVCTCESPYVVSCTLEDCAVTCVYDDTTYPVGASFPAGDGCNTCSCQSDGSIACTQIGCAPTCKYAGKDYVPGETFPALDGCNTCTCGADGSVSCTEINCPCDASKEWWREYVGKSPEECATIKYTCPEHTTPFSNSCGCGCEQDPACPQWFDCMPPAPCDPDMLKKCPYSGVAY